MAAANIKAFGGMRPAIDETLLPDTAAAYSQNCYMYSGNLRGYPETKVLHTLLSGASTTAFRLPETYDDPTYLYGGAWMEFENADTDVVRAPVFGDTYDRFYWASTSDVPMYNTRARIENGDNAWVLGVPTPASLGLSSTGGVGAAVTRTYGITYVSAYGEEGAMKASAAVLGKVDDTWNLVIPAVGASDDGGAGDDRNLTHINVYRTVVGTSGVATYFFVAQLAASATSYADTASDSAVSINAQLESQYWSEPPTDLEGFVVMSNGFLAGWRGNEVWFSEPYRPHAWPASYALTVEYPIIGLGVSNQTLVVCTSGYPVTMTGNHPAYMTQAKLNSFEPCTSRGGIISAPEGVYYTSPNGLILVANGNADNITKALLTRDKWQGLTQNTKFKAARLGTAYYAFGSVQVGVFEDTAFDVSDATGGFTGEDFSGSRLGIMIDMQNERVGFNLLDSEDYISDVFNDPWSGEVFIVRNGEVQWLDQVDPFSLKEEYTWKSKKFQMPAKKNLSAAKVYFTPQDGVSEDDYGTITFYADDQAIITHDLTTSGKLLRLPSGFKADFWQFEVTAQVEISSIQFGSTPKDLRNA